MVPEINLTPQLEARFNARFAPVRRRRRGLAAQRHDATRSA
jgi:primosomal protein N'